MGNKDMTKEEYCSKTNMEKDEQAKRLCKPCPLPSCAAPKEGCRYVKSDEQNADGCPKYPCGNLVCEEKKICCLALTAACLACKKDMTKEEYCSKANIEKDERAKNLCTVQLQPIDTDKSTGTCGES